MTDYPTRAECNRVHNQLESTGWRYSHSICHADNDDDYGSTYFYRGGPLKVYVNRLTMQNIQAAIKSR